MLLRLCVPALGLCLLSACQSTADLRRDAVANPPLSSAALAAQSNSVWPLSVEAYRTTSGTIYLGNLDARIEGLQRATSVDAGALAAHLYHRYKLLGRLNDAEQALRWSEQAVRDTPRSVELQVLRATVLAGFHQFSAAADALREARQLSGEAPTAALLRAQKDLDVALGNYVAIADELQHASPPVADFYELAHRADLRVLQGDLIGAEWQYRMAQSLFNDIDPVPLAWLHTQMGIALLRFERIAEAAVFFRAATERLPGYVLAEEHLAECEFLLGDLEASRSRYLRVITSSGNPEFMAALAEVEAARGDSAAAEQWRLRAAETYQDWLTRHPSAFAWHAAEFFAEQGDTDRAYELALSNRRFRNDVFSEILLAQTAAAGGHIDEACAALQRIEKLGLNPPERRELSGLQLDCGS